MDFSFNGIWAKSLGIRVKKIERSILPDNQDTYQKVPGRAGSYLFPNPFGDMIISIDCDLVAQNNTDFREKVRNIATWLNTTYRVPLILSDEPDKYYMGKVANKAEIQRDIIYLGEFTLEFNCEPFAYESQQLIYSIWLGSSPFTRNSTAYNIDYSSVNSNIPRYWPLGTQLPDTAAKQRTAGVIWQLNNALDYLLYDGAGNITLYQEASTKSFYMAGTAESYPVISIKGTNTSGQISVTLNGYTFSFTGALTSSDTLVIDCQKFSVKKNGVRVMAYFSGDFPKLSPGNNTLSWSLSGGATLTELKITTQGRWY